ncbi:MAG: hypothetical protein OEO84_06405 [Betaproteobacteria bacterium]|nr:hypothetical protein [Betaproteobacteria bacterium]
MRKAAQLNPIDALRHQRWMHGLPFGRAQAMKAVDHACGTRRSICLK